MSEKVSSHNTPEVCRGLKHQGDIEGEHQNEHHDEHQNDELRNYNSRPIIDFYQKVYSKQNYHSAQEKRRQYEKCNNKLAPIQAMLELMDSFVDPSDPDVDLPNSLHAYQTAERIRRDYPDDKEFQVVGLVHDLGKVLFSFGESSEWIVGDTFILGCEFPETMVCHDLVKLNQDYKKPQYQGLGIYQPNCGLDSTLVSFGHDEYLYMVLKNNYPKHHLSESSLRVIRYHSLYPFHDKGSYQELLNDDDKHVLFPALKKFNKYDLYSKLDRDFIVTPEIKHYYDQLLKEYFPEPLWW